MNSISASHHINGNTWNSIFNRIYVWFGAIQNKSDSIAHGNISCVWTFCVSVTCVSVIHFDGIRKSVECKSYWTMQVSSEWCINLSPTTAIKAFPTCWDTQLSEQDFIFRSASGIADDQNNTNTHTHIHTSTQRTQQIFCFFRFNKVKLCAIWTRFGKPIHWIYYFKETETRDRKQNNNKMVMKSSVFMCAFLFFIQALSNSISSSVSLTLYFICSWLGHYLLCHFKIALYLEHAIVLCVSVRSYVSSLHIFFSLSKDRIQIEENLIAWHLLSVWFEILRRFCTSQW